MKLSYQGQNTTALKRKPDREERLASDHTEMNL